MRETPSTIEDINEFEFLASARLKKEIKHRIGNFTYRFLGYQTCSRCNDQLHYALRDIATRWAQQQGALVQKRIELQAELSVNQYKETNIKNEE